MSRVSRLPTFRTARLAPAGETPCAPVLTACPATLFVGMSGPALQAAGTMYAVALDAARRQVEREQVLRRAATLN